MADQRREPDQRPSPEALLAKAEQEESVPAGSRSSSARRRASARPMRCSQKRAGRLKEGIDVVVGVVETHGRKETEALTEGLEVDPAQARRLQGPRARGDGHRRHPGAASATRSGRRARAHQRAGSRHPKRYLDVEELLNNGIDVYTTLNIQHIESLNDIVAQITHVRVRETVPDSILDRADAIELVDITPEDLIQRLRDGKVYIPQQAERALEHFFSPANLTALRELALRRTAERVDEQMLSEMQARAIPGPWAAGERLLVCIGEDPRAAGLVRYTKRLADRLHASWTALYVETKRSLQLSEEERDRIADTLRLAQALGGEPVTVPSGGRHIADDVVAYARANNITQIVIGKSTRSRMFELLHGSVVRDLLRQCGNISLHVIAGEELDKGAIPKKSVRTADEAEPFDPRPYLAACVAVGVATSVSEILWPWIGLENTDLVFLTAIVGIAVRFGLWPSLFASVASALCYNFFFTEPYYTFSVADPRNVVAILFFTIVAVIVSNVAARARSLALAAMSRARTTESLYVFSRKLSGVGTLDDVLWATAYQIALMLKVRVVLLLPENGSIEVKAGYPPRTFSIKPISPRRNGHGSTIGRQVAAPTRCLARSGCFCPCAPAGAPSAWSASTATRPARF